MTTEMTTWTPETAIAIVPPDATGNRLSRLGMFQDWLQATGRAWTEPDLAAYRDTLLDRVTPNSARAHLSTIRGRYRAILRDNTTRDLLYGAASARFDQVADRKAFVDETITRLENALHPSASAVQVETVQDQVDADHVRLTLDQAQRLIDAPGLVPLQALRDTAVIGLLLATGIRETELVNLNVSDLRQTVDGILGLHIRQGKGAKTRFVPFGVFADVLVLVDAWLDRAGIAEGAVFRGLRRDGETVRPDRLTARQVQRILKRYPVAVNGRIVRLAPHDCRRSYARICYVELRMDLLALSRNLGHADVKTTMGYIGDLTMADRKPTGRGFTFDLSTLAVQDRLDA